MSAAKGEAEDGPDLSSDENSEERRSLGVEEDEKVEEGETPIARLRKANGIREEDHTIGDPGKIAADTQSLESGGSSLVGTSHPEHGRPSSADGSISIPDDTPSLQVSNGLGWMHVPF